MALGAARDAWSGTFPGAMTEVVDNARPWTLDFETEEDATRRPVEAQLERFLSFAQDHDLALRHLRAEVTEDQVLDAPMDPLAYAVRLDARPPERAPAFELARTGERSLRKVLAVFAFVGDEVRELSELADAHFLPACGPRRPESHGRTRGPTRVVRRSVAFGRVRSRSVAFGRVVLSCPVLGGSKARA